MWRVFLQSGYRPQRRDWLAEVAVQCEPVFGLNFPANREINRDFRLFTTLPAIQASQLASEFNRLWQKFPNQGSREFFWRNREFFQGNRQLQRDQQGRPSIGAQASRKLGEIEPGIAFLRIGDGVGRHRCIFEGWKPMHGQPTLARPKVPRAVREDEIGPTVPVIFQGDCRFVPAIS
jgi:hypothetical protein